MVKDSFDELDQQLIRQHRIARDEIEDTMAHHGAERRGRDLYRKCTSTTLPLKEGLYPRILSLANSITSQTSNAWDGILHTRRFLLTTD